MFKKYPLYTVSIIVLAILQHFVFSKLVILNASPDLLCLIIALISMSLGQRTGTTYGFAAGLIMGFLSGNLGLSALVGTVEGFAAGFFHVPEDSHATSMHKKRMFYIASLTALLSGNILQALLNNPLSLPMYVRLPEMAILGTGMSMLIATLMYHLVLKKFMRD